MWLLPQLPAGRWMAGRPYKKPILLRAAFISRISLVALRDRAGAESESNRVLAILLPIVMAIFRGLDAVAAVAWFDMISKMFPPHVRGKILGWTQSAAFATQFLSAFVVAWALGTAGPAFPYNYALLMGLAALFVMVSWSALLFFVEPPGDVSNNRVGAAEHRRDTCGTSSRPIDLSASTRSGASSSAALVLPRRSTWCRRRRS